MDWCDDLRCSRFYKGFRVRNDRFFALGFCFENKKIDKRPPMRRFKCNSMWLFLRSSMGNMVHWCRCTVFNLAMQLRIFIIICVRCGPFHSEPETEIASNCERDDAFACTRISECGERWKGLWSCSCVLLAFEIFSFRYFFLDSFASSRRCTPDIGIQFSSARLRVTKFRRKFERNNPRKYDGWWPTIFGYAMHLVCLLEVSTLSLDNLSSALVVICEFV